MDTVAETAAAIGMHFGTLEVRQRAMGHTEAGFLGEHTYG